jgi:hypothetical protein
MQQGIAITGGRGFILSCVHTEDIYKTAQVQANFIEVMIVDGTFTNDFFTILSGGR